jgi:DNA-binding MarR family transcriptional regulator
MASSAADTDIGSDVVLHLLGLMAAMHDHFHACITEFDLTASQADALRNLGEPRSQRDLAQRLKFDASNVTAIVDRLEERGLVERQVDAGDRRVRRVVLTPAGEALRRGLFTRVLDDAPPLRALSPAERRTLRDLLAKMVDPIALPF